MRVSQIWALFVAFGIVSHWAFCPWAYGNEIEAADALVPEHARLAIQRLSDPSFQIREAAANELFGMGGLAIRALEDAAQQRSLETSVRVFDILVRLYRLDDERVYSSVEKSLRALMHSSNLAVAARAERVFESVTDLRRVRGIAKFKQLGGFFHEDDVRPFVLLDREWRGGDDGARLIECFSQTHDTNQLMLIVVKGAKVSDEVLLELSLEMPRLHIQRRGPARLGVSSNDNRLGCVILGVESGSAAERAGLQVEDRIVEIDGVLIENFTNLVDVIEKKEPGTKVPIVFLRGEETRNVIAELLPWR